MTPPDRAQPSAIKLPLALRPDARPTIFHFWQNASDDNLERTPMISASSRHLRRSASNGFDLGIASLATLAAALMAGCGASGGGTQSTLSGTTAVTLLASSTANDKLSELTLNITGLTLTDQQGKSVTLLSTPLYIEFMHLNGIVEPLATVTVPQDVYTSATITANYGVPLCETYDSSNTTNYVYSAQSAPASSVTANLPQPLTITGTGMGLELNLQVSRSTNMTDCASIVEGPTPFSYTPTFDLTPVGLTAQPTNTANGRALGLRGLITSVTGDGTGFTVPGDFGAGLNGPTWQITTNSSTVFQGITGASQLAVGLPVDMDVDIQPGGDLLATRVAVHNTNSENLSFAFGPQSLVFNSPPNPGMSALAIETQGPFFVGFLGDGFPYYFSSSAQTPTAFQISGQMTNLNSLPFTPTFSAATLLPGQTSLITTLSAQYTSHPVASTITLLPQTIDATVNAIASSSGFTTYTVSLASYDLFLNLAGLKGQSNVATNPGTIIVYTDSNTQMLNTEQPAVGSVLRFYGLLFDNNGALSMDCAQVNDGVAE